MKRFACLIVIVLLLSLAVSARAQHRIGVVGGLNFADINADTDINSRTVFGIGGVVDLEVGKNFALHLEPMYIQKGGEIEEVAPEPGGRIKSSFLEVPVFLKYSFGKSIKPYLIAGPTIGYLLSQDIELVLSGITLKGDMKDVTESFDFGFGFGAGVTYPLSRISIFLEGHYTLGLSNLQKGGSFEVAAGPVVEEIMFDKKEDDYKNRGFQIMAGITFPLSGR